MKKCVLCSKTFPKTMYGVVNQNKDGLQNRCFICRLVERKKNICKRNNIPFNLEIADIKIPAVCPIFGEPLIPGSKDIKYIPSLDRVIPNLGYVKGNVQVISFRANSKKKDATLEELKAILKYMKT